MHINRVLLVFIVCFIILSGCASTPSQPTDDQNDTATASQATTSLPAADAAAQRGDYQTAAQLYLAHAQSLNPPQSIDAQLKAVTLLIEGNILDQAQAWANALDFEPLTDIQKNALYMSKSTIAYQQDDAYNALQHLELINETLLDDQQTLDYLTYKADVYSLLSQPEDAFLTLSNALKLAEGDARFFIELQLWNTLTHLPMSSVYNLSAQELPMAEQGWLELVRIFHSHNTLSSRLDLQLDDWQNNFPQHPASSHLIDSIKTLQSEILFHPKVIAVLLPESGPFAQAAQAIKTGIIAAFMQQEQSDYTPELRFYNTGELTEQAINAYNRATQEGAELIIGPLSKDHVSALALLEHISVPTIALNNIKTDKIIENLYLFGLSPEDEAQQVADKAWLDGYNHSLSLVPNTTWGQRLSQAFSTTWKKYGGNNIEQQSFDPSSQDFSKPLQALLNLDESNNRIRALKQLLGELKTEPRRRQDVDFIFLAANPQQARQIRPQLKFFYAESIPIYATSHVYGGSVDRSKDHDMNDIIFNDMPWVLIDNTLWQNILHHWPNQAQRYKRLYALGIDSYNIIPQLRRLSAYKFQQFPGATGVLSINEEQRIQRQLLWARFVNGRPAQLSPQQAF